MNIKILLIIVIYVLIPGNVLYAGQDSRLELRFMYNFSKEQYSDGNIDGAIKTLEGAVEYATKTFGREDVEAVHIMFSLATFYAIKEKYSQAETLFTEVVSIAEKTPSTDKYNMGLYFVNFARMYQNQGNTYKALPLYNKGFSIWQSLTDMGESEQETYSMYRGYYQDLLASESSSE